MTYQTILNYTMKEILDLFIAELVAQDVQLDKQETPEQWEKRTGKPWPDNAAVYALHEAYDGTRKWYIASYGKARHKDSKSKHYNPVCIICATEAGPPPDDWKPEEAANAAE